MKNKWRMPHPATMFMLLTMAVVFLSFVDMRYLRTESDVAADRRGYPCTKSVESGRNPLVATKRYQELHRLRPVGHGDYRHVRLGRCAAFRLY